MLARVSHLMFGFALSCFMLLGQAKAMHALPQARSSLPNVALENSKKAAQKSVQKSVQKAIQKTAPKMEGSVSFYGEAFAGRKTANGEGFDPSAFTMAHRSLPFGTLVRVTLHTTKKSVIVRVNDRGPFTKDRVGDLSFAAAQQLGIIHRGVGQVGLSIVKKP
jgi:rare lipoprotein A